MSNHGGKPSHCFNEFVHVKKDVKTRKQRTAKQRTANNLKRQLNQLPELDEEDDNLSQASFSTRSTASTFTSGTSKRLCTNNSEKVQSTINQYIGRKFLPNEIDTFYRLLLRMTISNGWAFQWVENQKTIKFFNFISPLLKLPNRKTLADELLKNSAERVQNNIEAAAKDDKYGVSISLDGWKNVVEQNILGLVITRSDGQSLAGRNDLSDVTVVHEEKEGNNDNKLMASKIISIIDNPDFWINLVELEKILYPYCVALNLIAVPVGDEEIDDSILEPPELDVDDIDDKSDNGDNDEVDEFIKLWFEGLNEEDISENDTSDNEINENLNIWADLFTLH
ncbi:unnamed protein product [Rhizophagus irregularis]|nr:unnamed protein product [Rhizophagus irregularis]